MRKLAYLRVYLWEILYRLIIILSRALNVYIRNEASGLLLVANHKIKSEPLEFRFQVQNKVSVYRSFPNRQPSLDYVTRQRFNDKVAWNLEKYHNIKLLQKFQHLLLRGGGNFVAHAVDYDRLRYDA